MMSVSDHEGTSLKKLNATSLAKGQPYSNYPQGMSLHGVEIGSPLTITYKNLNQDPIGPKNNQYYVVQGGSWYRSRQSAVRVRLAARFRHFVVCYTFGFRLVREL